VRGGNVSVAASITGSASGYQWYKDGQSLGSGQQSATLGLGGVQAAQAGSYELFVTGGCGSAMSTAFSLTVNALPVVTLLVNNATVNLNNNSLPVITLNNGLPGSFQVLGGVAFERFQIIDRINGFEIRQVDTNATGVFTVNRTGLYNLTITDANGCKRTVQGEIR